jgi:hypothetical protein
VTKLRKQATAWSTRCAKGLQVVASIFCLSAISIAMSLVAGTSAASQQSFRQELVRLDILGGSGGNSYEYICGPGRVLVGFRGYTGVWIDSVQAVCAKIDANGVSDAQTEGPVFGGNPNVFNSAICPDGTVIAGLALSNNKDNPFLGYISPVCARLFTRDFLPNPSRAMKGSGRLASEGGRTGPLGIFSVYGAAITQECPGTTVAVGIHGRAGKFLDALGLICGAKPATSAPDMSSSFLGQEVSFQSSNYPDRFIRHRNSLGFVEVIPDELGKNDATFKIVPGLAGRCVSFESHNYSNHFLRHQNSRLKLAQRSDDQLFRQDASFCMVSGLADSAGTSFESVNYPGHFLRHRNSELWLDRYDGSELFRKDATFRVAQPGGRVNVR